jgi:FixJ family two-component response regulator
MAEKFFVYVVDDDDGMRASLSDLFRSVGYSVRDFNSAEAFLEAKLEDARACLISDIRLRGASGLELQQRLMRDGVRIPVVLMTGCGDVEMYAEGMKAGAVRFLEKTAGGQDILDAVSAALAAYHAC